MGTAISHTWRASVRAIALAALLLTVFSHPSAARHQALDQGQEVFRQLTQKALSEGTVPVILRLAVPGIDALSAASAAVPGQDVSRLQAERRDVADAALRNAIETSADRLLSALQGTSFTLNNRYTSIPFLALRVSPAALDVLRRSPEVAGIEEDVATRLIAPRPETPPVEAKDLPKLDGTVNLVGAATAWSWGFTGSGWYVAILDTGIRSTHQFFAGKSIVEACFAKGQDGVGGAGDCPNGQSTQTGTGSAAHHPSNYDGFDHGTHVAGIAAGKSGSLAGIAKDASIIAVQVFSKMSAAACDDPAPCVTSWSSDTLAALDWVYSVRGSYRVASANLSLGGGRYSSACDSDSRRSAVEALRNAGIATAIAAGNDGWCGSVSSPGCISSAVGVGASTDADNQSSFSNWHPSLVRLFAPGSSIYSSTGTSNTSYASWSGTSMATPHVAGAWALMKQVVSNGSVTDFLNAFRTTGVNLTSTCDSRRTPIPRFRVDRAIATLVRYQLTLRSSAFGTTDPPPGSHFYAPGTLAMITPIPESNAAFVSWSGSASGSANPLSLLMDGDKTVAASFQFIHPPGATGRQVINRSFSQGEYINVLTWTANAANQGLTISKYRIYTMTGGTRTLLVELPASQSEYPHRHVAPGAAQYTIAAVTHDNREGAPALVAIQ